MTWSNLAGFLLPIVYFVTGRQLIPMDLIQQGDPHLCSICQLYCHVILSMGRQALQTFLSCGTDPADLEPTPVFVVLEVNLPPTNQDSLAVPRTEPQCPSVPPGPHEYATRLPPILGVSHALHCSPLQAPFFGQPP